MHNRGRGYAHAWCTATHASGTKNCTIHDYCGLQWWWFSHVSSVSFIIVISIMVESSPHWPFVVYHFDQMRNIYSQIHPEHHSRSAELAKLAIRPLAWATAKLSKCNFSTIAIYLCDMCVLCVSIIIISVHNATVILDCRRVQLRAAIGCPTGVISHGGNFNLLHSEFRNSICVCSAQTHPTFDAATFETMYCSGGLAVRMVQIYMIITIMESI